MMTPLMIERRRAFFAFQGLLTVVLLLFFLYQRQEVPGWGGKFAMLSVALLASLLFLRMVPARILARAWTQGGLFIADAAIASLTLHWTQNPSSDLYLAYFLIILGSALTRDLQQSFLVALCASILYIVFAWDLMNGLPRDPEFWLRLPFLWTMASLSAILSQDSMHQQQEQERRYQEKILQMERIAALGQFSGEVAHRIKGPLTTILLNADMLAEKHRASPESLAQLDHIRRAAVRCRDILRDLLNLGRAEETKLAGMDFRAPVRAALDSLEPLREKLKVELVVEGMDRPAPVLGDAGLLFEAVSAVLQNGLEAMPSGGRLTVRLGEIAGSAWLPSERKPAVELWIEDTGSGISVEAMAKIFQPFFTTKSRDGSGLGLPAALRILQNHRGAIEAASDGPGRGAKFRLTIPRH